jgi:hypothetical protein
MEDLFGIDPRTHARTRDPSTSKRAAVKAAERAPTHAAIILEALKKIGVGTFTRIAQATNLTEAQVWRRLHDLQEKGLAEPTGYEIDGKRVWRAASGNKTRKSDALRPLTCCGSCSYEEADGSLIEQCHACKAKDAGK